MRTAGLTETLLQNVLPEFREAQIVDAIRQDEVCGFPVDRAHLLHYVRVIYHVAYLHDITSLAGVLHGDSLVTHITSTSKKVWPIRPALGLLTAEFR
jgi:hypothetical protein